jgi:hypothetical protein
VAKAWLSISFIVNAWKLAKKEKRNHSNTKAGIPINFEKKREQTKKVNSQVIAFIYRFFRQLDLVIFC